MKPEHKPWVLILLLGIGLTTGCAEQVPSGCPKVETLDRIELILMGPRVSRRRSVPETRLVAVYRRQHHCGVDSHRIAEELTGSGDVAGTSRTHAR